VDATVGGGGHAFEIARRLGSQGRLIGLDRDEDALKEAGERLKPFGARVVLIHANFADLGAVLNRLGRAAVDGVLFDLGVSSYQLDTAERGFSFREEAPLDMRMDRSLPVTAADLANTLSEEEVTEMLHTLGEEPFARRIARGIVKRRQEKPFRTTRDLTEVVLEAIPRKAWPRGIHPATRTFMAFRIRVNGELEALERGLQAAIERLRAGGRVCVISYHSLEDRIVKRLFLKWTGRCQCPPRLPVCVCGAQALLRILTRKPITPSQEEAANNPRSRSARLRAAEKLGA